MSEQHPTVGRIVIYVDGRGVDHPAVITAVRGERLVNLKVFLDGPQTPWMENVPLAESGDALTCYWPKRA